MVRILGCEPGDVWFDSNQFPQSKISRKEFEQLKRDVQEMKELLKRAKKYDEDTDQRDCEMVQKIALLRKIAEAVGVNLNDVFGEAK